MAVGRKMPRRMNDSQTGCLLNIYIVAELAEDWSSFIVT